MARFELARAAALLREQDGVVARRQLLAIGATANDLRRLLRRHELHRAFGAVYIVHNGPATSRQRQWIAVLAAWPAALTGPSALPDVTTGVVHVAIAHGRTVHVPPGTRLRVARNLASRLEWGRSPPRVTVEHALLDLLSERVVADDVAGAFHALTQSARRTTPTRLLAALEERPRIPGRRMIRGLIRDLRDGACSVLERGFLHQVERAHGLPAAVRQRSSHATGKESLQDLAYPEHGLVLELDGRTFHLGEQSDVDALRDLSERAVNSTTTVRITYGLVFRSPCRTARLVAMLLQQRGWDGSAHACYRCHRRAP